MMTAVKGYGIYTKLMELMPKYVMVNNCEFNLSIFQ